MWWLAPWIGLAALGLVGVMLAINRRRFDRLVALEASEILKRSSEPPHDIRRRMDDLPAPARRYLSRAMGQRDAAVSAIRLRHRGTFRPRLDGPWLPIEGVHYLAADPPSFVWRGRVRIAPGVCVEARDRSVNGVGGMLVKLESTFTLADASGRELDESALQRLLGEMVWLPTIFLDPRWVSWSSIDDRRARATLRVNGREAAGDFEFGDDDLPADFHADRHRDLGGGKSERTPFVGRSEDYREVGGLLLPHRMMAAWILEGRPHPYVRFEVEQIELDPAGPY